MDKPTDTPPGWDRETIAATIWATFWKTIGVHRVTPEMFGEADPAIREGYLNAASEVLSLPHPDTARVAVLEEVLKVSEASLSVCRQSLFEQASARADPTMPLLTSEVVEAMRIDAECLYGYSSTRQERVEALGLLLLCDWQDQARASHALNPGEPG